MDATLERIDCYRFEPSDRIFSEYSRLRTQKENTCGAYSILPILRALGYTSHHGHRVDEDYVSFIARVNVSSRDMRERQALTQRVKNGKTLSSDMSERLRRTSYRYSLPVTMLEKEVGCSPQGVKHALETISGGELHAIPLVVRPSDGGTSLSRFSELLDIILRNSRRWSPHMILNLQCGRLLDPTRAEAVIVNLIGVKMNRADAKLWKYSAGHFVNVGAVLRTRHEHGQSMTYFVLLDSFKELGIGGMHLQPLANIWKALRRGDGRQGGILLIVPSNLGTEARKRLSTQGFEISLWDNGSPFSTSKLAIRKSP